MVGKLAVVFGVLALIMGVLSIVVAGSFAYSGDPAFQTYFPGRRPGPLIDLGIKITWGGAILYLVGRIANKLQAEG